MSCIRVRIPRALTSDIHSPLLIQLNMIMVPGAAIVTPYSQRTSNHISLCLGCCILYMHWSGVLCGIDVISADDFPGTPAHGTRYSERLC